MKNKYLIYLGAAIILIVGIILLFSVRKNISNYSDLDEIPTVVYERNGYTWTRELKHFLKTFEEYE